MQSRSDEELIAGLLRYVNAAESANALAGMFAGEAIDADAWVRIFAVREQLPGKRFETLAQLAKTAAVAPGMIERFLQRYRGREWDWRWEKLPFPREPGEASSTQLVAWNDCPVLLLPVRIETRFMGSELLVRIYPDQIFIDAHERRLKQSEVEAGHKYLTTAADQPHDAWRELARRFGARRAAWIRKTLIENGTPRPEDIRPESEGKLAFSKLMALPDRFAVYLYRGESQEPLRDPVFGEPISRPLSLLGKPSTGAVDLFDEESRWMSDFDQAVKDGMGIRVTGLDEVDLSQGFSRVVVVGIRSDRPAGGQGTLEQLLENHHYANGLGFVPWGTPTNNGAGEKSGHSATTEDRETSYDVEVVGPQPWVKPADIPRTNAHRLGHALGFGKIPSALRHLAHAGADDDSYAQEMQTALWPCTGDYLLRNLLAGVLSDGTLARLGQHFANFVRAAGPLPSIRVGSQPYGVLPAMSLKNWKASELDNRGAPWVSAQPPTEIELTTALETYLESLSDDSYIREGVAFDEGLHRTLSGLLTRWLEVADDPQRVPRIGTTDDPDKELLQILAMEPLSTSYRVRPFVDESFVGWLLIALRDYVFGADTPYALLGGSPLAWVQRWNEAWVGLRAEQAEHWREWVGLGPGGAGTAAFREAFRNSELLKLTGWWNARPLADFNMDPVRHEAQPLEANGNGSDATGGPDKDEIPETYLLDELYRDPNSESDDARTLLREMLRCSLRRAPSFPLLPLPGGASWLFKRNAATAIDKTMVRDAIRRLAHASVVNFLNAVTSEEQIAARLVDRTKHAGSAALRTGIARELGTRILMMREALPHRRYETFQQVEAVLAGEKESLGEIVQAFRNHEAVRSVDRLARGSWDLCSHRLDAWVTSLATKRLQAMRRDQSWGIHLGAYGYVENLRPDRGRVIEDFESAGNYQTNSNGGGNRLFDPPKDERQSVGTVNKAKNYRYGTQSVGLDKKAIGTPYGDILASGRAHDLRDAAALSIDVYLPEDFKLASATHSIPALFIDRPGAGGDADQGLLAIEIHLGDSGLSNSRVFLFPADGLTASAWNTLTFSLSNPHRQNGEGVFLGRVDTILVRFVFASKPAIASGILVDWLRVVPGSAGFIHASSSPKAAAAALLHNAYLTHADDPTKNPFRINLNSSRVRHTQRLLEGIRQGQPLGALLGYQFERGLHERGLDAHIDEFRKAYPLVATKQSETPPEGVAEAEDAAESVEARAARNVVDGLALVREWEENPAVSEGNAIVRQKIAAIRNNRTPSGVCQEVERLRDTLDGMSDALMYEGAYHAVQGNYQRASAAIDAISGQFHPPELESLKTRMASKTLAHRVLVLFPGDPPPGAGRRASVEPRVAAWAADLFGDLADIGCTYRFRLPRININEATQAELASVPGMGAVAAEAIVNYRSSRRRFRSVDQLETEGMLDAAELATVRRWIMVGTEPEAERSYERIDVNTASPAELGLLGLDVNLVLARRPYASLETLADTGVVTDIEAIRPFALAGATVSLAELGLDAVDLLYLSASPVQGEETEIERRIQYVARNKHVLAPEVRVAVDPSRTNSYAYGLEEALELGRAAFDMLAAGHFLRPELLGLASQAASDFKVDGAEPAPVRTTFLREDVVRFDVRIRKALHELCTLLRRLGAQPIWPHPDPSRAGPTPSTDGSGREGAVPHTPDTEQPSRATPHTEDVPDESAPHFAQLAVEPDTDGRPFAFGELFLPPAAPEPTDEDAGKSVAQLFEERRYEAVRAAAFAESNSIGLIKQYVHLSVAVEANLGEPLDVVELLRTAAAYGIPSALLRSRNDTETLRRWMDTLVELLKRVRLCQGLREQALGLEAPASTERRITLLIKAARALFGQSFLILPDFEASDPAELSAAFRPEVLGNADEQRVRLWLQQLDLVNEPLRQLDQTLEMAEAWRDPGAGAAPMRLHVGQLPTSSGRWLALDDEERGESPHKNIAEARNVLSLVAVTNTDNGTNFGATLSGVVLYDRTEYLPSNKVDTSIAIHYDGPNSQAPQSLLLAVPADRKKAAWTTDDLASVVVETMDLAKARLVDPDAMGRREDDTPDAPGVGMVLPSLILPCDPKHPGSANGEFPDSIEGWLDSLVRCQVVAQLKDAEASPYSVNAKEDWEIDGVHLQNSLGVSVTDSAAKTKLDFTGLAYARLWGSQPAGAESYVLLGRHDLVVEVPNAAASVEVCVCAHSSEELQIQVQLDGDAEFLSVEDLSSQIRSGWSPVTAWIPMDWTEVPDDTHSSGGTSVSLPLVAVPNFEVNLNMACLRISGVGDGLIRKLRVQLTSPASSGVASSAQIENLKKEFIGVERVCVIS